MFDFSKVPFYDNHTHSLNLEKSFYSPLDLSVNYLHGYRDLPEGSGRPHDVSEQLEQTLRQMGVVKVMVNLLAQRFGCPATLEAVNSRRNQLLGELGPTAYAQQLFHEENIVGCTVDELWPVGDAREEILPGKKVRLFRMDPLFDRLMTTCDTYIDLKKQYLQEITQAVRQGYRGIKCHVGERFSFAVKLVSEKDASAAYASAQLGDKQALASVYYAVFAETLLLGKELNIPVHVHTGNTGGAKEGDGFFKDCDPLLLCPFLSIEGFRTSNLVLLHTCHPHIANAALMTQMYPNVWVDVSWVSPWIALDYRRILKTVLGVAPHNKIMLGTGQHGIPEMAWLSAKVAKQAMGSIMTEYVNDGLLSQDQATETAEQVLYQNACRLYGLN